MSDPGGWHVYRIVTDYERKILPELRKLAVGERLPAQNVVMPLITWFSLSKVVVKREREKPAP